MLVKGFLMGASLIIAIGAQNAFVIKQGLSRTHLFLTAFLCAFLDACLIALGVLGFGEILDEFPITIMIAKYFAVIFLVIYGGFALRSAFKKERLELQPGPSIQSLKKTVWMLIALSLLNPHAYLDTVILLGSIASQYPFYDKLLFAIGAVCASFAWFFFLTYGSRLFAPLLKKPIAWKIIDASVCIIMWSIAIGLLLG